MAARVFGTLVATGLVAAGLTWGIARGASHGPRGNYDTRATRPNGTVRLVGHGAEYSFQPASGRVVARTKDGSTARTIDLVLVVDGEARPLALERSDDRATERNAFGASFGVTLGEESFDALVALHVDPETGGLLVDLGVQPEQELRPHTFALRFELPVDARSAFVSGVGELGDFGSTPPHEPARAVEVDAPPHAFAIVPAAGALDVETSLESPDARTTMRLAATASAATAADGEPAQAGLRFVFGDTSASVWKSIHALSGQATQRVHGVVTGGPDEPASRARVYGLDAEGYPRVRARVGEGGRFDLEVPRSIVEWYAALDPTRTSTPITFEPGTPWDLHLDVSPGGELSVRVVDADTSEPLLSRILVHGVDGTLDPTFGPDYRASGAGPLVDALHGELTTPLPAGRYRVAATRGPEWSIDAKTIDVKSGRSVAVDLALRHVVPTPGLVACDLHVHARPSFDTPVLVEDRVLSLVSAGIDFAVPSEHNIVGDYSDALATLDLAKELATVQGIEITTFAPRFGHFGLFPYAGKVPPYKGTNVGAVFNFAHKNAPGAVLQVNHPRLGKGIGYFDVFHFDPKRAPPYGMRTDFDTIEVYNGYESRTPDKVDAVLHDWFALLNGGHRYAATGSSDSHRIQYQWAGYPRTMAAVGDEAAGDHGAPVDPQAVVAAIKKGHAFVTSGPMVDFTLAGAHPGDEVSTEDAVLEGHVVIRAAPWMDVTSLEIVVGGKSEDVTSIASRPTAIGPELGDRAEAEARTVRYDADVKVTVPPESTWVVAVVRGTRPMDDVLPFMPVPPLAFTNPVYVTRSGLSSPPLPLAPTP